MFSESRKNMRKCSVTSKTKYLFAALTAVALSPMGAAAQEACSAYTVKAGDSLGSIALSAYGSFDYQMIFNANREAIAGSPNNLKEGLVLQLPCADGRLTADAELSQVTEQQEIEFQATKSVSNLYEPPIRMVTGGGWEPYVGEDLLGGGFMVRLATTSLHRGGNNREHNVSFVNDWSSHKDTLLPMGAMDISIAWSIPDCTKIDMLSSGMKQRCNEWDYSEPVYEIVMGLYTTKESEYANARSFSDFEGATICRPEGWSTYQLEEEGLIEPVVTMMYPTGLNDCVEAVLTGAADMAFMELESAVGILSEMGMDQDVVANPILTKFTSMRFVTHKSNPRGRVYVTLFNRGLNEMRQTGEWYDIVATGLAEYNQRQQATN